MLKKHKKRINNKIKIIRSVLKKSAKLSPFTLKSINFFIRVKIIFPNGCGFLKFGVKNKIYCVRKTKKENVNDFLLVNKVLEN